MSNVLKLSRCAYIFDNIASSHFFCSHKEMEKALKIRDYLMKFYDDQEMRNTLIEYKRDIYNNIIIQINGENHYLNDLQISFIDDQNSIINHKRNIDIDKINSRNFHSFTHNSLYSNNFKSLIFEFYTNPDDLGYIRVHFKNNNERFVIDDRNGDIYTSGENGRHILTNAKTICKKLNITSEKARKEFYEIINTITRKEGK